MIRIQLYLHHRIVVDRTAPDDASGNRAIDALISEIHKGQHGTGKFGLFADRVNEHGLFIGTLFHAPDFCHPTKRQTA